jgi:hypothetical protein
MLADWTHALGGFRQLVPVAAVQAPASQAPEASLENAPKTAA